jgi:uncharacterized membrane protein YjjP (DUF1212 family)
MNLYCKEVELWQTPTHITYMCHNKVNKEGEVIKDQWRSILYRYIQWVEQTTNGVYEKEEDVKEAHERVNEHIKELKSYKRLNFYIM